MTPIIGLPLFFILFITFIYSIEKSSNMPLNQFAKWDFWVTCVIHPVIVGLMVWIAVLMPME